MRDNENDDAAVLRCHAAAFEAIGGVPREIRYSTTGSFEVYAPCTGDTRRGGLAAPLLQAVAPKPGRRNVNRLW
jgi:transposase